MVNAADGKHYNPKYRNSSFNGKTCSYCGRVGHTVDVCYRKHGFLPNFKPRNATNLVVGDDVDMKSEDRFSVKDQAQPSVPSFSQEEYKALMNLLKTSANDNQGGSAINHVSTIMRILGESSASASFGSKAVEGTFLSLIRCLTSVSRDYWIIDSGVTNHICTSLRWFIKHEKITLVNVNLPNSSIIIARHVGIVKLNESLVIKDVLYIPEFSFNLISISNLTL